ncbi:CD48 antigen-like, partial [Plectropomus leopardus]|uniref:CD48 antigen-like n=1 Tax=Plectropomus leopardus TaxID=160734 RepID=UPI001C4D592F
MKRDLKSTEGGSVTFPDPLVEFGFVLFEGNVFALVKDRRFEVFEESYKDRLLWNNKTGHFTITGLQKNDSGVYYIDSKKGNVFTTSYKLTVYESVPTPAVSTVSVSADGCTLLCSVKKAEEVTLSWIKDEEILNQTDSVSSLPLTVHEQDFSFFYRCVATNHVETKTLPVNITTSCSQKNNINNRGSMDTRHYVIGGLVPLILVAVI